MIITRIKENYLWMYLVCLIKVAVVAGINHSNLWFQVEMRKREEEKKGKIILSPFALFSSPPLGRKNNVFFPQLRDEMPLSSRGRKEEKKYMLPLFSMSSFKVWNVKVSHLTMFTKTPLGPYMKIARFPRGPTLTFKIKEYSLGRSENKDQFVFIL